MLGGGECRDSWVQKGLRKWQVTDGHSPLNERCSVPSKAPGTSLLQGGRGGAEKMEEPKDKKKGWECHSHGNHELKAASDAHPGSAQE